MAGSFGSLVDAPGLVEYRQVKKNGRLLTDDYLPDSPHRDLMRRRAAPRI